jgi:hypothetical protein
MVIVEKKYPFKFLDAYGEKDSGFFFGREEEVSTLYEMVFQSPILLVYGASGTGKTSVIQCGLASKFAAHDWLALPVRRGLDINANLKKALADAGGLVEQVSEKPNWLDKLRAKSNTPAARPLNYFDKAFKAIYLDSFKPVYLIFDQFEELFILGSKDEQDEFIASVVQILQVEQPVKMIFSIREEYLGNLSEFEKAVPQLFRKKLRVEPMNCNKVRQVIIGATQHPDSNVSLQPVETDEIAKGIFNKIKGTGKSLTIQLPYLQVSLDKLYLEVTGDETRQSEAVFTLAALDKMGDIGDVLQNFLEEQVAGISKKLSGNNAALTLAAIWSILSPFATLEGTKEPIDKQELYHKLPNLTTASIDLVIEAFINGRILKYNEDVDLYELAHDALAKRIAEKRSDEEIALLEIKRLIKSQTSLKADARELFSEKQLNFIEPFLKKLNLSEDERKLIKESEQAIIKNKKAKKRQFEWFVGLILVALAGMTMLAVWAMSQENKARMSAIKAEASAKSAIKQKYKADSAARVALKQEYTADSAVIIADYQKRKADSSNHVANKASKEARTNLARANKLLGKFVFFHDKFAVAVEEDHKYGDMWWYGVIDKNADVVIPYTYSLLRPFNEMGLARGRKDGEDYLVDTAGNNYRVAYKIADLNSTMQALDLSAVRDIRAFPNEALKNQQLQILLFKSGVSNNTYIDKLPGEINTLVNLKYLDLSGVEIDRWPGSIAKLKNLISLKIRGVGSLPDGLAALKNLKFLSINGGIKIYIPELKRSVELNELYNVNEALRKKVLLRIHASSPDCTVQY